MVTTFEKPVQHIAPRSSRKRGDVSLSMRIQAEPYRVLYALTIPEYMEAWLKAPEADHCTCLSSDQFSNGFCVEVFSGEISQCHIYGHWLASTPEHLILSLKKSVCEGSGHSIVDFRLKYNQKLCTVSVAHRGIGNVNDAIWFSEMWEHSLTKMRSLLEGVIRPGDECSS